MTALDLDLDEHDDPGYLDVVRPIMAGVLRVVAPPDAYVVKVDSWFGERWLGTDRKTLRLPPFVPARVVAVGASGPAGPERVTIDAGSRDGVEVDRTVVAADGLGGFSGGDPGHELETKRWLLENEGALPPALV